MSFRVLAEPMGPLLPPIPRQNSRFEKGSWMIATTFFSLFGGEY